MSEVARRRIAALLLIAGIAVAALAIADAGPFEDPPTEEERVEEVVREFFDAAAAVDGERYCALLTRDARRALGVNIAQQVRLDEPPSCADGIVLLQKFFGGLKAEINHVSVSGPEARVEIQLKVKGAGAGPRTVLLTEKDGEWLVSDPG